MAKVLKLTRPKRDAKIKFEPEAFRDQLVALLEPCSDLEAASNLLEATGGNMDYRRYSDQFFDLLIAGGLLAPGGTLVEDSAPRNRYCVFASDGSDENIRAYVLIFDKILRRYKYMQALLEEELDKVLKFIKAFTDDNQAKLAKFVAMAMSENLSSAKPLTSIYGVETLVKDQLAEKFVFAVMRAWIKFSSINSLATSFRKSNVDMMMIFPPQKRSYEYMVERLEQAGDLQAVITWQKSQRASGVKKDLQSELVRMIAEEKVTDNKRLITMVVEVMSSQRMEQADMITLVWHSVMDAVEWNKKIELLGEQALKQINQYAELIAAFTPSDKLQSMLMVRIQLFCYENQNFLKAFNKIIMLLYQRNVISEAAILDWYNHSHSSKGKTVFLEQMADTVKWLQTAEVEPEDAPAQ